MSGDPAARTTTPLDPARFKTKECKFFSEGTCQKGSRCAFIHPGSTVDPASAYAPAPQQQYAPQGYAQQPAYEMPYAYDPYQMPQMAPMQAYQPQSFEYPQATRSAAPRDPSKPPHRFKTQVCKFFNEGKCQRGEACTFLHEGEVAGSVTYVPPPATLSGDPSPFPPTNFGNPMGPRGPRSSKVRDVDGNQVCRFFLQDKCSKGTDCPYSHASPKPGSNLESAVPAPLGGGVYDPYNVAPPADPYSASAGSAYPPAPQAAAYPPSAGAGGVQYYDPTTGYLIGGAEPMPVYTGAMPPVAGSAGLPPPPNAGNKRDRDYGYVTEGAAPGNSPKKSKQE